MINKETLNIVCAGECMAELTQKKFFKEEEGTDYTLNFSGDVINFAVYLKRLCNNSSIQFFSAIGNDLFSKKMKAFFSQEGISADLVSVSRDKTIGIYLVYNNEIGDRDFLYWRCDSAARQMLQLADQVKLLKALEQADYFYFTGITLAILDQNSRDKLFDIAKKFRLSGKIVIFDPNYRPQLWPERKLAKQQFKRSYEVCNILLSSMDDEYGLWSDSERSSILHRLSVYDIDEIVLSNGSETIVGYAHGETFEVPPAKPESLVDTTAAGDGFNAGYIAARHGGDSPETSVIKASRQASMIVAHAGAILPK